MGKVLPVRTKSFYSLKQWEVKPNDTILDFYRGFPTLKH